MPTFTDWELENTEIPRLARMWRDWRNSVNDAIWNNFQNQPLLSDCFNLLSQTYDIFRPIFNFSYDKIKLEIEYRSFNSHGLSSNPQAYTPDNRNIFRETIVAFGKAPSHLKSFWGLFEREDDVCFFFTESNRFNQLKKIVLTPKQVHKFTKQDTDFKLRHNVNIPNKLYQFLVLHHRPNNMRDSLALVKMSTEFHISVHNPNRRLLDVAVREFSIFGEREGNYGWSGISNAIQVTFVPSGASGISGVRGATGVYGIRGFSGLSEISYNPNPFTSNMPEERLESGIIPRTLAEGKVGEDVPEEEKSKWDLI